MVWNAELPILLSHTLTGVWVEIFYPLATNIGSSSHPHGCVSWNKNKLLSRIASPQSHPHGCVSWNFLHMGVYSYIRVTPSRVCELKFYDIDTGDTINVVTPSRVCELKSPFRCSFRQRNLVTPSRVCELKSEVPDINWFTLRHTLTGVWVEIMVWNAELPILLSHTLTGVWVEMVIMPLLAVRSSSHPHGCVSWNEPAMLHKEAILVTPSRVCELK